MTQVDSGRAPRERIAFVTGRLAEQALKRVVNELAREFGFEYDVVVLEISVAALMTPTFVEKHLRVPTNADRVLLPGYCHGDLSGVEESATVPVARGPKDLRGLQRWFEAGGSEGAAGKPDDYGEHRIEIVAEINHVPRLSPEETLAIARRYRDAGADLIDVGCDPDGDWAGVADAVKRLRDDGHRVAVDSFDPREIERAVEAGAELVLSVHGKNIEVARGLDCEVVAIPDDPRTLSGLDETLSRLDDWKVPHRIDPVIEPIGFGFAKSLGRYLDVRDRFPDRAMLMGIGNITELTDVDSAGVNALLIGFCAELGIDSVLTTEVITWARTSVREIDIARRLMHYAVSRGVLPKHLDEDLIMLRDAETVEHGQETLDELAAAIRDPNFRIFAERGEIHVMNRDGYERGDDAFELFDRLDVEDPSHAFYLGFEMAKAWAAVELGKQYQQDRALRWGFLTREEVSHFDQIKARRQRRSR
jgi:dihydropteroate synthase